MKLKGKQEYSVLLLAPDYLASSQGQETTLVHVTASSPYEAKIKAQEEVCLSYGSMAGDDFAVLFLCKGKFNDLKDNAESEIASDEECDGVTQTVFFHEHFSELVDNPLSDTHLIPPKGEGRGFVKAYSLFPSYKIWSLMGSPQGDAPLVVKGLVSDENTLGYYITRNNEVDCLRPESAAALREYRRRIKHNNLCTKKTILITVRRSSFYQRRWRGPKGFAKKATGPTM